MTEPTKSPSRASDDVTYPTVQTAANDIVWPCCEHCATRNNPLGTGDGHADPCHKCQRDCPRCGGSGEVGTHQNYWGQWETEQCRACDGTGIRQDFS